MQTDPHPPAPPARTARPRFLLLVVDPDPHGAEPLHPLMVHAGTALDRPRPRRG